MLKKEVKQFTLQRALTTSKDIIETERERERERERGLYGNRTDIQ